MKTRFVLFTVLLGLLETAHADPSVYTGTFRPYFYNNSLYIEEVNVQNLGGVLGCVRRPILRLTSETTTSDFKNQYAMLLAAWYSGRTLTITGTGNCTSEGDETILQIKPN